MFWQARSNARWPRVAHEANRAYCATMDDHSQPPWDEAPEWQKASAVKGVEMILDGHVERPEQSHEGWVEQKVADGWQYGPIKDPEAKRHPCIVPFKELPPEQQTKGHLFFNIVKTLE